MKIIDLLNKIANGEEVPEYIRYYNKIDDMQLVMLFCKENIIYKLNENAIGLNDEVEIIKSQEHKIPEKFEIYDNSIEWCCNGRSITDNEKDIMDKINEILDYLEVNNGFMD